MTKRGLRNGFMASMLLLPMLLGGCGSASDSDRDSLADSAPQQAITHGSDNNAAAKEAASEADGGTGSADSAAAPVAAGAGGNEAGGGTAGGKGNAAVPVTSGMAVADAVNKKLIYHATLDMEVKDYEAASARVQDTVDAAGGYIVQITESSSENQQGGSFVFKVPAAGFSPLLAQLEALPHEWLQRSLKGDDVTEEYVDLEARLKAKELLETQYIEFMKKATKATDLVTFANQLNAVQEEIERMKGRMRYIDQNVSYSTIELHLQQSMETLARQREHQDRPLLGRAGEALSNTLSGLWTLAQWLFVAVAGALPVLILGGAALAAVLLVRKRRGAAVASRSGRSRDGGAPKLPPRAGGGATDAEAPEAPPEAPQSPPPGQTGGPAPGGDKRD